MIANHLKLGEDRGLHLIQSRGGGGKKAEASKRMRWVRMEGQVQGGRIV